MRRTLLIVAALLSVASGLTLPAPSGASAAGQFCGGFLGIPCGNKGEFCEFASGTCGKFDLGGACVIKPHICTRIFRPVCGCNGRTYGNDCVRQAAGVSKLHDGKC